MSSPLASLLIALFLSLSSLLIVFLRVSPLVSPEFALPFFFASVFGAVSSAATLLLAVAKSLLPVRTAWPARQVGTGGPGGRRLPEGVEHGGYAFLSRAVLKSSLRQGVFMGSATCIVFLLFLLRIHNLWIAVLIYAVFILIEMAVGRP